MTDAALEAAALSTVRDLLGRGLAGLDERDHDIFAVMVAGSASRDLADEALDILGAAFYRDGAFGTDPFVLLCRLPYSVRLELELEGPDAPRLQLPLVVSL